MNYTLIYTFLDLSTDSIEQIEISGKSIQAIERIWLSVDKTHIWNVTVRLK